MLSHILLDETIQQIVEGSRDAKDNYLLTLAEIVPLDYLVTGDQNLLVLNVWYATQIITFAAFEELIRQMKS